MDADGIDGVLREVFGNPRTETIGGWVTLNCPLAQWTHPKGRDSRASAGISIQPNSMSVFNCFTCGNKAPLQGMLRKYADFTGEDLGDLIKELDDEAYLGPRELPDWETSNESHEQTPLKKAIYLDLYDSAAGHPYLVKRGISKATAHKLQLMVDPADPADGEERILFPVFGVDGELYGLSGRATSKKALLKVRDYFGLRKAANLLGAHLIAQEKPDKVIVVEGLFDYANAWDCEIPAVAVMHSTVTEQQAAILRNFALPTYSFFDDDDAGKKGNKALCDALYRYQPVMLPKYPGIWIEDESEPDGGHWLKDPGELDKDEFNDMIASARLYTPTRHVYERSRGHPRGG